MARVTKHYADGRFGQIHYRQAMPNTDSQKPPLLLFHMSPYSGVIYEAFMARMGHDRLVIAVDTPGFGYSEAPPAPPDIADYSHAMGDLMDVLKLRHVDVMGYHTGSMIGLELCVQRPAQIRKIVMVSAAIFNDAELAEHRATFAPSELSDDGSHLMKAWAECVRWSMPGRTKDHIARTFYARTLNHDVSWWGHHAAFNYSTADALDKITHPILILNPEDDLSPFTPRAKAHLKNGRIHDLPGWSHGFLDVKTNEAVQIVGGFLNEAA